MTSYKNNYIVAKDIEVSQVKVFLYNTRITKFGYKLVCNQLTTTYYVSTNKIIHMYFSHMTYLMSYMTSLNNTCKWFYKLSRSEL